MARGSWPKLINLAAINGSLQRRVINGCFFWLIHGASASASCAPAPTPTPAAWIHRASAARHAPRGTLEIRLSFSSQVCGFLKWLPGGRRLLWLSFCSQVSGFFVFFFQFLLLLAPANNIPLWQFVFEI